MNKGGLQRIKAEEVEMETRNISKPSSPHADAPCYPPCSQSSSPCDPQCDQSSVRDTYTEN